MYSPDYSDSNNKLDEQILKLRQCKTEMLSLFNELDNITKLDSSKLNFSFESYRNESLSDTLCSHPAYIDSINKYRNESSDSESSDICTYCDSENSSYLEDRNQFRTDSRAYSPAKIKISYRIPPNKISNTSNATFYRPVTSASLQFSRRNSFNSNQIKNRKSTDNSSKNIIRPAWVPNGKLKNSNQLSKSTSFLNKTNLTRSNSVDKFQADKFANKNKANPKLSAPWRPNGKSRPDSAKFLSSQDLSKSNEKNDKFIKNSKDFTNGWKIVGKLKPDDKLLAKPDYVKEPFKNVTVKRKVVVDKNDIGGGWKTILGKPKPDDKLIKKPYIEKEPIKTVTVKRKVIVDEKDIGRGWKTLVGKPKSDDMLIKKSEVDKEPFKTVTVKKKVMIDKKDVGKGWKPIGKIKEDPKIFEPNKTEKIELEDENKTDKKKKFIDEKDIGKGWKPSGKSKEDLKIYSRPPIPVTGDSKESKKPLVKKEITSKKWIPSSNKKSENPNTWLEDAYLKTAKQTKNINIKKISNEKLNKNNKSNDRVMTSTPNISKNFEENELEESFIEKDNKIEMNSPGEFLNTDRLNASEINKNEKNENAVEAKVDDDLNEKITQDDNEDDDENPATSKSNKNSEKLEENSEEEINVQTDNEDDNQNKNDFSIVKQEESKEESEFKSGNESNKLSNNEENSDSKNINKNNNESISNEKNNDDNDDNNDENNDDENDEDQPQSQLWKMNDSDDDDDD